MSDLIQQAPTSIGTWVLLVAKTIAGEGVDPDAIFAKAGIDLQQAKDYPESRFLVSKMATVWQEAVVQTNNQNFALSLVDHFQPSTYSALGVAISTSKSLADGLRRLVKYYTFTSDAAQIRLIETDDTATLDITVPVQNQPCAIEAIEALVVTSMKLSRLMSSDELAPISTSFTHHADAEKKAAFDQYLKCPTHFGQPATQLVFDKAQLQQENLYANPELAVTLENWMQERIALHQTTSVTQHVQQFLLDNVLLGETSAESAAAKLNMSVRSMQRKLREEGSTFNKLLSSTRHHIAMKLVADNKLPLSDIALTLGFADQSSFNRAFKTWTGETPKRFQRA